MVSMKTETVKNPVVCAHRGFMRVFPENTLQSFAAAIEAWATELELDLRPSKDGVIVLSHEAHVRTPDGRLVTIANATFDELKKLDLSRGMEAFQGITIASFDEFLERFAGRVTLGIHVKDPDNVSPLPEAYVEKIAEALRKYACTESSYFICGNNALLEQLARIAPEVPREVLPGNDPYEELVPKAIRHRGFRIGLYPPYLKYHHADYVEKTIKAAHENGILCGIDGDDLELAAKYFDMGMDSICTGNVWQMVKLAEKYCK